MADGSADGVVQEASQEEGGGMRTILALALMASPALADQTTTTIEDANGRDLGRTVTDDDGRTTIYDNMGRQQGRSVTQQDGTIILYDEKGRQVGTVKEKRK